ncbi:hypothetical protein ACIQNU_27905 [Streptomyces sp. NPDC091292]|uniref:hypothetical protein n=1 Tax=Streptomyces sp. NPDC091292 TaxID=3365991 RepID=UPI0037FBC240
MSRPARGSGALSAVRRLFAPHLLVAALVVTAAFTALGVGAIEGPRWLLVTGATSSAVVLAMFGVLGETAPEGGVAMSLRSGGPRAFAPAVVHSVRAVDTVTGLTADPQSLTSVFAFQLTVVPPDGSRPYRIQLRHPLDHQGLLHRTRAVVEYDPRQPWRVILPPYPPTPWLVRADNLDPETATTSTTLTTQGLPPGSPVLIASLLLATAATTTLLNLGLTP